MRILQLCNKAPYPPNDGSSIAIYNMGVGFIANNVDLHVLTINTKKHFKPDAEVEKEYKINSNYQSVYRDANVSLFGLIANLFSSQSYFVSRFYFKEFENALIGKLKNQNFDVVQIEGLFMGVYIPVIKKYSKAKIVLRAHNVEHLIWERHIANERSVIKKSYLSLQNKRLKQFELAVLKQIDAIVSITDHDKGLFRKLDFKLPIYTCITGVDVSKYKQKETEAVKPRTIFCFASMDWMPNVEAVDWFLQHCWAKVSLVQGTKFIIAGRHMPERFLKLNLPNVQVIEKVESSKKFYNQHEIMLVPLLSGSGLRIKIIEGMAYGKAIVSTSVGAEGINISNGKNIIIEDDPAKFTDAVIELLQDENKRHKIEKEAQLFAEKEFDNAVVVSELVNFYKTVLNV